MSFEPPDGILDIGNATLRVGKLEVAETSGLNQGLLNIVKNNILINENIEYSSSNTWGIKLPTTWVADFDVKGHSTTKYVEFNFYNEDKTSNALGYLLNFKDTTLSLMYDTSLDDDQNILATATIPTIVGAYRKVNIFFERGVISVSIDGTRYLYHKETDGFNQDLGVASRVVSATGGAFVNVFIEQDASNSKFKNLRIVNGRFISDKTSNIAFIGGNLGVGVNSPQEALDIRGNMHFNRVSNVSQISVDSNVVTEYTGPHDRPLRKYPEVALTANDNSSTSGYVASTTNVDNSSTRFAFNAFIDSFDRWQTGGGRYVSGGIHTAGETFNDIDGNSHLGDWIQLQLPTKINLSRVDFWHHHTAPSWQPQSYVILGSNDGSSWKLIYTQTNSPIGERVTEHLTTAGYFKYFRLVVKSLHDHTDLIIRHIQYYGHEEGSGSLDTTLKTVYNVPATTGTQLEVYYDGRETSSYSGSGTTVTDLSGNGVTGTLSAQGGFENVDNIKAFTSSGSTTHALTATTSLSGSPTMTISAWVKFDSFASTSIIYLLGTVGVNNQMVWLGTQSNGSIWTLANGGAGAYNQYSSNDPPILNSWIHVTAIYSGGTYPEGLSLYINGILLTPSVINGSGVSLTLPSNSPLYIGTYNSGTSFFDGSIANFRLYSKVLNADQIKELYDYQKDYFLGSKSQVTLYKGHLGVGVTEPSGQLELAGDERIQEYPPGPLGPSTSYETLIPGHGVFCWDTANYYSGSPVENFNGSGMYAKDEGATGWYGPYNGHRGYTAGNVYAGTDFAATDSSGLGFNDAYGNRYYGAWTTFKLPYKINLKRLRIRQWGTAESVNSRCAPEDGVILGSNDGTKWYHVHTFTGLQYGGSAGSYSFLAAGEYVTINCNTDYNQYVLITTRTLHYAFTVIIGELQWFGTPGPTTLDKGSLTLGRSLDVPRISRYDVDTETPRPEKLVLDFDTTVNSSPTDISGQANHGNRIGTLYSASDKAYNFDGSNDYISIDQLTGVGTGAWVHSKSFWFRIHSSTDAGVLFLLGRNGSTRQIAVQVNGSGQFQYFIYGCSSKVQVNGSDWYPDVNRWYHCVTVFKNNETTATGGVLTGREMYIDGVKQTLVAINTQVALNLDSSQVRFGNQFNSFYLDYQLSNPKLYSVALEPSEVKKLYNLGRTGRSMVISDTAVGIGKAPESNFDVRGIGTFNRIGIGVVPKNPNFTNSVLDNHTRRNMIPTLTMYETTESAEAGPTIRMQTNHGTWDLMANENTDHSFDFDFDGVNVGYLRTAGNDRDMNNFTGQHRCFIKDVPFTQVSEMEGLIVSSDQNKYIRMSKGTETGSNAITTNESLPIVSLSKTHWDKKCFGVISASEDPEKRFDAYGSFTTPFEKEEGDTRVYINSVGEGAIWVANTNGSLEAGDYISTSDISGYGQRQGSDYLKNYTVAKITMDCDFSPVSQPIEVIKKDEDGKNVLDAHGQIQWENHTTETEKAYKIRYLDASGAQTDESNAVHIAAFVGCTYHCG